MLGIAYARTSTHQPALGALFGLIGSNQAKELTAEACEQNARALGALLYALGLELFQKPIADNKDVEIPATVIELAEKRWSAKQSKDYPQADACVRTYSIRAGSQRRGGSF